MRPRPHSMLRWTFPIQLGARCPAPLRLCTSPCLPLPPPAGRLLPGAYAFVHLRVPPHPGSVTIPSNALLFRAEGLRAGVVRNGHVELTLITIGQDYGNSVEVVSGLTPQDAVITNPSDSLANGSPVQVVSKAAGGAK